MKSSRGLTLLELVIAVSLTTILAVAGLGSISRTKQREDLLAVVVKIVQLIEQAQERSIAGAGDKSWQVILTESMVRLADADGNGQEFYQLPSGHRLITGGVSQINFLRPSGLAQECPGGCYFELRVADANVVYQFRVLYSGAVEY